MSDRSLRVLARLFARGYPAAFRERHGAELVDALAQSISNLRQRHPWLWLPLAIINAMRDLWQARVPGTPVAGLPAVAASAKVGGRPGFLQTLAEVRLALRRWRTRPAMAMTAIATLALGIGS